MIDSVSDQAGAGADLKKSRRVRAVNSVDRLPPNAIEAERAVIGCCITTPVTSTPEAQSVLNGDFFYDHRNKEIWRVICSMEPDKIDLISVRQVLKDAGKFDQIGGDVYLSQCQDEAFSSANLPEWIRMLIDKEILRRIIATCTSAIADAYEGKTNILDELEKNILAIRPNQTSPTDIRQLVQLAITKIEQKCLSDGSITGLSTGLIDLDKLTDGLHGGEMIVLAALPSRGKTALAINIAVLNALRGVPVAILSAEMQPVQLVVRSICSESRVNFQRVQTKDFPNMTMATSAISKSPLFIEQASGFTIGQVMAIGRRLKQKHDIRLMVVDYQQRLTGIGDTKEQQVASISAGIKDLCMELNIPIILLSQVNEAGQTKHARATTEDCDSLWKLDNESEWQPLIQPVKLNVEKCRDGQTGTVYLTFLKEITRFENMRKVEDGDYPQ